MKRIVFALLLLIVAASAAAQNHAPAITAGAPVYLNAGGAATSATVATVSDAEDSAGSLAVSATSVPSGIALSDIANSSGTITATIAVACDATAGENDIVLQVVDSQGATASATF